MMLAQVGAQRIGETRRPRLISGKVRGKDMSALGCRRRVDLYPSGAIEKKDFLN